MNNNLSKFSLVCNAYELRRCYHQAAEARNVPLRCLLDTQFKTISQLLQRDFDVTLQSITTPLSTLLCEGFPLSDSDIDYLLFQEELESDSEDSDSSISLEAPTKTTCDFLGLNYEVELQKVVKERKEKEKWHNDRMASKQRRRQMRAARTAEIKAAMQRFRGVDVDINGINTAGENDQDEVLINMSNGCLADDTAEVVMVRKRSGIESIKLSVNDGERSVGKEAIGDDLSNICAAVVTDNPPQHDHDTDAVAGVDIKGKCMLQDNADEVETMEVKGNDTVKSPQQKKQKKSRTKEEKAILCTLCNRKYQWLARHMRDVHKIVKETDNKSNKNPLRRCPFPGCHSTQRNFGYHFKKVHNITKKDNRDIHAEMMLQLRHQRRLDILNSTTNNVPTETTEAV